MSQEIIFGFEGIEKGICEMGKGIKLCRHGLSEIMLEHYAEGERELGEGICLIEGGLGCIEHSLKTAAEGYGKPEDERMLGEGICHIKEGLQKLHKAAEDIGCGDYRRATEHALAGIDCVEDGLCEIEKGLDELNEHFLGQIREGLEDIREGEALIARGIEDALNDKLEKSVKHSSKGLCDIEGGLEDIQSALRGICFPGRHEAMRQILECLRDLREGAKDVEAGIELMLECQVCEGVHCQRKGLRHMRESVDCLEEGLRELFQRNLHFC